jgi:hypothetical protein
MTQTRLGQQWHRHRRGPFDAPAQHVDQVQATDARQHQVDPIKVEEIDPLLGQQGAAVVQHRHRHALVLQKLLKELGVFAVVPDEGNCLGQLGPALWKWQG